MVPTVEKVVAMLNLLGEMPESELCEALGCNINELNSVTMTEPLCSGRNFRFSWHRLPSNDYPKFSIYLYED